MIPSAWDRVDRTASPFLVIGYGNTLRHDDAVGSLVAEEVAKWGHPEVLTIAVFQLTPELAANLATARTAIFVDARIDDSDAGARVEAIRPLADASGSLVHAITPEFLLRLSQAVYGRCPRAWLVSVPTQDFSFGEGLSAVAEQGVKDALKAIESLFNADDLSEPDAVAECLLPRT